MPARTKAGEIWLIDLGMTAKVRPCVLLSDYPTDDETGPNPRCAPHDRRARQPVGVPYSAAFF